MINDLNIIHSVASIEVLKGGASYTVCALASAQAALERHAVTILHPNYPGNENVTPSERVAQVAFDEGNVVRDVYRTRRLLAGLVTGAGTVLHDHGIWHPHNFAATGLAASKGIPYVINPHGMLEPWALSYRRLKKTVARALYQDRLLRGAACLMATAGQELESIRRIGFTNPVAIIPNGIDMDIPLLPRKASAFPRTALFLSRIHPKKGLVHAVEAWRALRPEGWQLKIVGPNEVGHQQELESLVRRHGLADSITFHPMVSGTAKYQCYRDADVFLLPTHSENFGVVVAESLACELPVITTVGTPWNELPPRGCGWYIDIGSQPLIETLKTVFATSPAELAAMGQRGRQWIMADYGWHNIALQNIAVYDWVLGRGPKPAIVHD